MRKIDDKIKEHLKNASTSMAVFVIVETKDGKRLRFNSSNKDIYTYNDLDSDINPNGEKKVVFKCGGYNPSIFSVDESNSVQKMDIEGMLSSVEDNDSNSFKYEMAVNNYYQGAKVYIAIANYEDPGAERYEEDPLYYKDISHIKISRANIGNLTIKDFNKIEIELRGFNQKLNNPVTNEYSRTCRARLFDGKCGLKRNNFVNISMVSEVENNLTFIIPAINGTPERFKNGDFTITSGEAKNQKGNIRSCKLVVIEGQEYFKIEMRRAIPSKIKNGDSINIYPGCDKTISNCKIYNNIDNFRGEPYIPGDDVFNVQGIGNE